MVCRIKGVTDATNNLKGETMTTATATTPTAGVKTWKRSRHNPAQHWELWHRSGISKGRTIEHIINGTRTTVATICPIIVSRDTRTGRPVVRYELTDVTHHIHRKNYTSYAAAFKSFTSQL